MNRSQVLILMLAVALSGCVVRTYTVTKDRVDQDLTAGNRGYLKGQAPAEEKTERKTTRTNRVVEVEFRPLIKFEGAPSPKPVEAAPTPAIEEKPEDREVQGNRGYLTQSETPEIAEPQIVKYKVEIGDTLQKISKKFYGTTKKWTKIYDANKGALSAPNKIYPGQVINVPASEKTKEKGIPANLK